MATVYNDEKIFKKSVTFEVPVTFAEDPPVISLDNIANLGITGDMTVGDDLIVTDDASVGGDLAVTGATTAAAISCTTLAASSNATVGGTLGVTGNLTGSATITGSDLVSVDDITCGDDLTVVGAATVGETLSVEGAFTVGGDGTLSVDPGAGTVAVLGALSASTSLTLTGASVVGLHEYVTLHCSDLRASQAKVVGIPSPAAGTIVKIQTRLEAALATGDCTITGKIANTGITTGVITITQSGSAAGDIDVCNPSGANTVAVGSDINFTVSGSNTAAVACTIVVTILRSA